MTDELRGQLSDFLRSAPATRDRADVPELVDALLPLLRDVVANEISMAADEMESAIENPEMPWAQGVMHVVDHLRGRVREIDSQRGSGGSV
jgi:hypothetical protein